MTEPDTDDLKPGDSITEVTETESHTVIHRLPDGDAVAVTDTDGDHYTIASHGDDE